MNFPKYLWYIQNNIPKFFGKNYEFYKQSYTVLEISQNSQENTSARVSF